jgi:hypothetical protein
VDHSEGNNSWWNKLQKRARVSDWCVQHLSRKQVLNTKYRYVLKQIRSLHLMGKGSGVPHVRAMDGSFFAPGCMVMWLLMNFRLKKPCRCILFFVSYHGVS